MDIPLYVEVPVLANTAELFCQLVLILVANYRTQEPPSRHSLYSLFSGQCTSTSTSSLVLTLILPLMLGHMAILQNHHHHKYIQFKSTCEHRPKLCFFGIDVCAAAFFLSSNN